MPAAVAREVAAVDPLPRRRARFVCSVRLGDLQDHATPVVQTFSDGSRRIDMPGLRASLDGTVDAHAAGGSIVLLLGHAQMDGRSVSASDLAARRAPAAGKAWPLGGRYALLVVDPARQSVSVQTDRFGVWPLCWRRHEDRIDIADRADEVPLAAPVSIDPQAIFDYVYFHVIPAPRTIFRGVSRVEPATALRFERDGTHSAPAWTPEFSARRRGDEIDLRRQFRSAIESAVRAEVVTGDAGCFLSGGTDSSTVAGTLKQVTGRAATFSIGFDATGYDEMAYARIAARHFGTDHHEHYVTPAELVEAIPEVAAHYDQPFGNSSAVPALICARLARSHGVRKLLAGDGGDELFGGNTRYAKQKIFEAWWRVPAALRGVARPLIANPVTRSLPLARKAASYVDQASIPMPARMETYNLLERFGAGRLFTPGFLAQADPGAPGALQQAVYQRHAEAPFVDRMLAYDWRFTLADNDLPKVTGTTRLAGLEVGFPLLADALVDVSTAIGPDDKVHGMRLRHFFKEALADFLPAEIIAKKKHGFGLPVGVWLVRDTAFREMARGSLQRLVERGLVQQWIPDDLFSRKLEEHAGYYGEMAWILMMLEQWLTSHCPDWQAS